MGPMLSATWLASSPDNLPLPYSGYSGLLRGAAMNEQVTLNGIEVWAYIVEQEGGFRRRLSLDDWDRCRLYRGERISLRRHGQSEAWYYLAVSVEMPPVAWFNLETQLSLAM
jgi:hypothetical protein